MGKAILLQAWFYAAKQTRLARIRFACPVKYENHIVFFPGKGRAYQNRTFLPIQKFHSTPSERFLHPEKPVPLLQIFSATEILHRHFPKDTKRM